LQECFGYLGYKEGDLPMAERLCKEVLSLPIYPELKPGQIEYIAQKALDFYK
jgi:UDP-2-acetamido-2-deoxy-ribo-hexuluronate aminotransferase